MNAATTMRPEVIWADMGGLDNRDLWSLQQACSEKYAEAQAAVKGANQAYEEVAALYSAASARQLAAWRAETAAQLHLLLVSSEIGVITAKSPAERVLRMKDAQTARAMFDVWASREDTKVPERAPVVSPKAPEEPVPFSFLAKLYLDEQKGNVKESSWDDIRHTCKVLTEALTTESGELNLREHTREDMIRLKADLLKTRKPSTVNKVLTRFSTVMTWAVNNNYLEKSYDKGLKIAKGADSARKAFSVDQVKAIMDYANSLETTSWERWGLTLGAITGARIGEVHQLLKTDIREVDGLTVIDINEDGDGKSIKNKHSRRLVPLIDGAYGFDLKAFKEYVDGCESRLFVNSRYFSKPLNGTIRKVLGLELTGELSYHSLRHSMASLLKSKGVQVEVAQAILGHSSSTITFDHYGAEERLEMAIMVEALRSSFGL